MDGCVEQLPLKNGNNEAHLASAINKQGSTFDAECPWPMLPILKGTLCGCASDITRLKQVERMKDDFVSMVV